MLQEVGIVVEHHGIVGDLRQCCGVALARSLQLAGAVLRFGQCLACEEVVRPRFQPVFKKFCCLAGFARCHVGIDQRQCVVCALLARDGFAEGGNRRRVLSSR